MTGNLQTTIKTTPKLEYHNQISKPKNKRKNGFKMPHVNTKFRSLTDLIFLHLNFSLSRKQRNEQKTTLFSLHSSILFRPFISCFKIHSN